MGHVPFITRPRCFDGAQVGIHILYFYMRYLIAFLSIGLFFLLCASASHCKTPPDQVKWVTFQVMALRIDDDAEYHITMGNPDYGIKSYHDVDSYEIYVHFGNIPAPVVSQLYTKDRDEWVDHPLHLDLTLPYNYKIETFDD
jgi:hypothetical protein